jgi:hypothetical protein
MLMSQERWIDNEAQSFSLCGHSGCGKLVPFNYDEDLCEMHEWEASEDAMSDLLVSIQTFNGRIKLSNAICGHLAASDLTGGEYLDACSTVRACLWASRYGETK